LLQCHYESGESEFELVQNEPFTIEKFAWDQKKSALANSELAEFHWCFTGVPLLCGGFLRIHGPISKPPSVHDASTKDRQRRCRSRGEADKHVGTAAEADLERGPRYHATMAARARRLRAATAALLGLLLAAVLASRGATAEGVETACMWRGTNILTIALVLTSCPLQARGAWGLRSLQPVRPGPGVSGDAATAVHIERCLQ